MPYFHFRLHGSEAEKSPKCNGRRLVMRILLPGTWGFGMFMSTVSRPKSRVVVDPIVVSEVECVDPVMFTGIWNLGSGI